MGAGHSIDKARIGSPREWPLWPLLPLKRRVNGSLEVGVITPDYPQVVVHATIFQVDGAKLAIHQLARDGEVEGVKTTRYQDVDAMLDDGWQVD